MRAAQLGGSFYLIIHCDTFFVSIAMKHKEKRYRKNIGTLTFTFQNQSKSARRSKRLAPNRDKDQVKQRGVSYTDNLHVAN